MNVIVYIKINHTVVLNTQSAFAMKQEPDFKKKPIGKIPPHKIPSGTKSFKGTKFCQAKNSIRHKIPSGKSSQAQNYVITKSHWVLNSGRQNQGMCP